MRKRARADGNQEQIVKELRKLGILVHVTSQIGGGFPDLVAAKGGRVVLLEVKRNDGSPSMRALTPAEVKFHGEWEGLVHIVRSAEEVLDILQAERRY